VQEQAATLASLVARFKLGNESQAAPRARSSGRQVALAG